jgi:hypothetical protein
MNNNITPKKLVSFNMDLVDFKTIKTYLSNNNSNMTKYLNDLIKQDIKNKYLQGRKLDFKDF